MKVSNKRDQLLKHKENNQGFKYAFRFVTIYFLIGAAGILFWKTILPRIQILPGIKDNTSFFIDNSDWFSCYSLLLSFFILPIVSFIGIDYI
jgi:hypothetical protein